MKDRELIELIIAGFQKLDPEAQEEIRLRIYPSPTPTQTYPEDRFNSYKPYISSLTPYYIP
jgi:hypothetical protein